MEEPTNQEYKLFQKIYLPIAKTIRSNKGKDPGMKEHYKKGAEPVELDTSRLLVLT